MGCYVAVPQTLPDRLLFRIIYILPQVRVRVVVVGAVRVIFQDRQSIWQRPGTENDNYMPGLKVRSYSAIAYRSVMPAI